MSVKRADVVSGASFKVSAGRPLLLNGHLMLSGKACELSPGALVSVIKGPRRIEGINLVQLAVGNQSFEAFYCDVLKCCEKV